MSKNLFQSDREQSASFFPNQSEIYQYKRNLFVLSELSQKGINRCVSFFDFEALKSRASRCQVAIAGFQEKYPNVDVSHVEFTPPFKEEDVQLDIFSKA